MAYRWLQFIKLSLVETVAKCRHQSASLPKYDEILYPSGESICQVIAQVLTKVVTQVVTKLVTQVFYLTEVVRYSHR